MFIKNLLSSVILFNFLKGNIVKIHCKNNFSEIITGSYYHSKSQKPRSYYIKNYISALYLLTFNKCVIYLPIWDNVGASFLIKNIKYYANNRKIVRLCFGLYRRVPAHDLSIVPPLSRAFACGLVCLHIFSHWNRFYLSPSLRPAFPRDTAHRTRDIYWFSRFSQPIRIDLPVAATWVAG